LVLLSQHEHRDEGGLKLGLVAAAKEEQTEQHLPSISLELAYS